MKFAGIYRFQDSLIVSVEDQTIDGIWKQKRAFLIDSVTDPNGIGAAVQKALGESRQRVPRPDHSTLSNATYPVLELSGAKTNSAFMKLAAHVSAVEEKEVITIMPWANKGARGGFVALKDKARKLSKPDDTALGAAVLAALADTE